MANPYRGQKNFDLAIKEILDEYGKSLNKELNTGLTKAGEALIKELERVSPFDPTSLDKHFKDSWLQKTQYNLVRYIGNTKHAKATGRSSKKGIPLSNLLEFSERLGHKGFMRKAEARMRPEIIKIIKKAVEAAKVK